MIGQREHGVLVGVDGTFASDEACRYGCAEAMAQGLPLRLLHAWLPRSVYQDGATNAPPIWGSEASVEAAARQVLGRAAQLVSSFAPTLTHTEHLVRAASPEALVEASRHARLLVVGGRERGRHDLSWLGSVPLHVVPRAHCPVVVVPTDPRLDGDVVVGLDGSSLTPYVVGFAFEQAARTGAGLRAVMAFSPAFAGLGPDSHQEADRREDTRRVLHHALEGWREKHPEVVVTEVLSTEHPLCALRSASDDARLVVVGSHGRGMVWRYALGSVSSALLRVAACPVAVLGPEAAR
jgi:nucleotide-binding universal stress UspA family protein